MTFDSHVHHPAAKRWFDGLADVSIRFCRMTQQGFLRLATNSKVVGSHALSMPVAWQACDLYLGDSRIDWADEPSEVKSGWRVFTQGGTFSPNVWNDAYLAAFAMAGGDELVSFDKGFAQFSGLNCTIPM